MKSIKFKKKSSVGDTEHIYVTSNHDISGDTGCAVEILTLTKHPEMYKHDFVVRLFKGYAVIYQITFWNESTLRGILGAIDTIKEE